MANEAVAVPGDGALAWVKPLVGGVADAVKESTKTLQGVFVGLALIAVVLVGLGLLVAESPLERGLYFGSGFALIAGVLVGYVVTVPKLTATATSARKAEAVTAREAGAAAAAVPTHIDKPVPESAVEEAGAGGLEAAAPRAGGLLRVPGTTFAFTPPGGAWTFETADLAEQAAKAARAQGLTADSAQVDQGLPFRPGRIVMVHAERPYRVRYLPDTKANGREVLGLYDEEVRPTVTMYSVGKRGLAVAELTAEHVFALLVGQDAATGHRVEEITRTPLVASGGTALVARLTRAFAPVEVDGAKSPEVVLRVRLHVIERGYFIYVIRAGWLTGVPDGIAIENDVGAIIDSVRITEAADGARRAAEDAAKQDAIWRDALRAAAGPMLGMRFGNLVAGLADEHGRVRAGEAEAAAARALAAAAGDARWSIDPNLAAAIGEVADAIGRYQAGDPAPLEAAWRKYAPGEG